jgi:peptidoglycan/xylan/chitin deacetylase (PgdA/CDA1 family)
METATVELELAEGLETVGRSLPEASWAPSAHSGLGIARGFAGKRFAPIALRGAARRVAPVPLMVLVALAASGGSQGVRESSGGAISSPQRPTAQAASTKPFDARVFHDDGGANVAATGLRAVQSFTAPASPEAVGSRRVSTYHVPVLMYHRIAPRSERGHDLPDLVLDPKRFDAQLATLKAHGWRTITSGELAAAMRTGVPIPSKTFVITIDDGHVDGYTHAFPTLKRYGFVATFFVITSRLDRSNCLTWAELAEMQAAGMEVGNHTVSHVSEAGYSRVQTNVQVMGAQVAIAAHLGVTPISFAYPYGDTPANLVASVEASGIAVAYTTAGGATETLRTAYLLPRVRVSATTTASGILWLVRRY